MSHVKHNAILITSMNELALIDAKEKALALDLSVVGPFQSDINGYRTLLIVPDGSKEGWDDSTANDARRELLIKWIHAQAFEDGSNRFDWAHVEYGELTEGTHGVQIANDVRAPHVDHGKPLTLRRLLEIVGTEFLDVPISVQVLDPHLNLESVRLTEDWPPRALSRGVGDPGSLTLKAHINKGLVTPRGKGRSKP
jgi:hypothetical protein